MGKLKCHAQFKLMMKSFQKEDVDPKPGMSIESVGTCYSDLLTQAEACRNTQNENYEANMEGIVEIPEDVKKEIFKAMMADKKAKRANKRRMRMKRGRRGGRRNNKAAYYKQLGDDGLY